jgi:hypothetical protein
MDHANGDLKAVETSDEWIRAPVSPSNAEYLLEKETISQPCHCSKVPQAA